MNTTQRNEVMPAAQHGKCGFLDLPPILRNTIYKLIFQSTLACKGKYMWFATPSPMVVSGSTRKVAVSAIAGTSRQIRTEFHSQELPNYLIVIHSKNPATYWNNHLVEIFKRGLRHLLLRGLEIQVEPCSAPSGHPTHFPFADYLDHENEPESGPNKVKLRAAHTDDASTPARTRFLFTFQYNRSRVELFDPTSQRAIRQVLNDVYSGNQVTSSADLVRAVDQLRRLNLDTRGYGSRSYRESAHQSVEYRYIIFDSPRRLKMTARQIRAPCNVGIHESFFDFEETYNHGSLIRSYEEIL